MKTISTYATRFVILVVAIQILNLSVYGEDFDVLASTAHQNKIGEFNQIDSLIEYVAEILLDHENAFPENGSHNPNSKSSHQIKHGSIKMIAFKKSIEQPIYGNAPDAAQILNQEYKNSFLGGNKPATPQGLIFAFKTDAGHGLTTVRTTTL